MKEREMKERSRERDMKGSLHSSERFPKNDWQNSVACYIGVLSELGPINGDVVVAAQILLWLRWRERSRERERER